MEGATSCPLRLRPQQWSCLAFATSILSAWNILHVVALLVLQVSAEGLIFLGGVCVCVCVCVWVGVYDEGSGVQGRSVRSQGLVICNPSTVQLLFRHRFLLAPNSPSVLLAVSSSRVL